MSDHLHLTLARFHPTFPWRNSARLSAPGTATFRHGYSHDMDQKPQWPGSLNLSDLGGLRLRDGGHTIGGRLFRSGRVESLDADGWRAAKAAGVRTIVDLRNPDEPGYKAADPVVDEAVLAPFERLQRPIEDQSNDEFMAQYGTQLGHSSYYAANIQYFPALVAASIEAIVNARQAVLFHCSAGKDRTGLIAAILLTLNGVVLQDVLDDYATAVRGYAAWQHAHPGRGRERNLPADELEDAVAARVATLRSWLSRINMAEMLVEQVGLDEVVMVRASTLLLPD